MSDYNYQTAVSHLRCGSINSTKSTRAKIYTYIDRVAAGGAKKNVKALGDAVFEVKINYGPGYRVYFGELDGAIILLLVGGDKSSQARDVKTAKQYWRDYVQK